MAEAKNSRTIVRVSWDHHKGVWTATCFGQVIDCGIKVEVLRRAVSRANRMIDQGYLGQIIIHGKNGRIQREFTYGQDSPRNPG